MIVTTAVVIMLFVILLVIAILAMIFIDPSKYTVSRWYVFLGTFAGLSIVVTFMFYYSVIELQQEQQKMNAVQEMRAVNKSIIEASVDEIQASSTIIPNFCASLFPLTVPKTDCDKDENSQQQEIYKTSLSYKLFDSWEVMSSSKLSIKSKQLGYISYFLQWCKSEQLHVKWEEMKVDFAIKTQKLGDMLFRYSKKVKRNTPQEYERQACNLIRSCAYQKLFAC